MQVIHCSPGGNLSLLGEKLQPLGLELVAQVLFKYPIYYCRSQSLRYAHAPVVLWCCTITVPPYGGIQLSESTINSHHYINYLPPLAFPPFSLYSYSRFPHSSTRCIIASLHLSCSYSSPSLVCHPPAPFTMPRDCGNMTVTEAEFPLLNAAGLYVKDTAGNGLFQSLCQQSAPDGMLQCSSADRISYL